MRRRLRVAGQADGLHAVLRVDAGDERNAPGHGLGGDRDRSPALVAVKRRHLSRMAIAGDAGHPGGLDEPRQVTPVLPSVHAAFLIEGEDIGGDHPAQ